MRYSCSSYCFVVLHDFTALFLMDPEIDHGGQLSLTTPRSSNFKGSADHFLRASNQTKAKGKGHGGTWRQSRYTPTMSHTLMRQLNI